MAKFQLNPGETMIGSGMMSLYLKQGLTKKPFQGNIYITNQRACFKISMMPGALDMCDKEDYNAVLEILSMIQKSDPKEQIIEKMQEIERIALNKAWGVMLSPDGKTIRLKKKELL